MIKVEGRIIRYYPDEDRLAIQGEGKDECYEIQLHCFCALDSEFEDFMDKLRKGELEGKKVTIEFSKKDFVKNYEVTGVFKIDYEDGFKEG